MKYQAAVFDMDGTVLNTVDDLNSAMNYAMEQTGHRHDYTPEDTRRFFGSGVLVALTRALAVEKGAETGSLVDIGTPRERFPEGISAEALKKEAARIQPVYKEYYDAHCDIRTGPYPGIPQLLCDLRARKVVTAVVSNKPDPAVQKLVKDYFRGMFDLAVGEQDNVRRKPFPDMTDKALKNLGISPEQAVYIGDSEIDMQTAENSHLDCISVAWGFRGREFLEERGAKMIVSRPDEILPIITGDVK